MAVCIFDGNFKLWRYKRAFAAWRRSVFGEPGSPGSLFFDAAAAARICEQCGPPSSTKEPRKCGPTEIAALGGKTHVAEHLMDPSACFMCGCAHRTLVGAFDFNGGEKSGLTPAMAAFAPRGANREVDVWCSDTMCRVHVALDRAQKLYDEGKLELPEGCHWKSMNESSFCVNALHVRSVRAFAAQPSSCSPLAY